MAYPDAPEVTHGYKDTAPTQEQYEGIVNGLANHEAKLMTMAVLGLEPSAAFTRSGISTVVNGAQGAAPGWRQAEGTPFGYLERSLAPIGCVAQLHIDTGIQPTEAYSATDLGATAGLAASGALLDWSLRHEGLSLQTVLGVSQSKNDNRAPLMRLTIMEAILTDPDEAVSFIGMQRYYPEFDSTRMVNNLRSTDTIFEFSSSSEADYNPVFHIESSDYAGLKPLHTLLPARQAIYHGIRSMSDKGVKKSSIIELTNIVAMELPEIDVSEVRQVLMQAASRGADDKDRGELSGLVFEDREAASGLSEGERSAIRIKPEYREACIDLVEVFEDIRTGRNAQSYRKRAREILADEEACAELMAKARSTSPAARALQRGTKVVDEIKRVLAAKNGQELLIEDIQKSLEEEDDIKLSRVTLRKALNKLVLQATIETAERASDVPGIERQNRVYWLKTDAAPKRS